jgi:alkanesulfonate monooxygenase SsuD/methylene tetrahydromethanopterin reductase-like flavin-dependent oxidoreductase (luciferase family)
VLPGITVVVGDTDADARALKRAFQLADHDFDRALAELGRPFGWHDFRQYDLDAPFPDVLHAAERSFRTQAEKIVTLASENSYTLRQTVQHLSAPRPSPFVWSPQTVAGEMRRWFDQRGLDGFNIFIDHPSQFRRFTSDVVPILQEMGVYRTGYESQTLRGNLGLPVPENRYAKARREAANAAQLLLT